jgi:F0F1-type ATP synthase epsilon subunit
MNASKAAVTVEISTPRGESFTWKCSVIELRTVEGSIEINPAIGNVLSLARPTEITLRRGGEFHTFLLENATANLKGGRLIVLAESIRQVEPADARPPAPIDSSML